MYGVLFEGFVVILTYCYLYSAVTAQDRVKQRLEELEASEAREQAVMLQLGQSVGFIDLLGSRWLLRY